MKVEANKTYIGVVEDNNDPLKIGRARVRVLDVFDNIEVSAIPWASPWKDLNGNEFNVPEKGKVLLVVFDSGDEHKPEFISADHYNVNLEKKLTSLSTADYISMKSLIFDHKTQIYVNDKEGLKIDHKYNNINITENTIDLNLKDNNRHVNIGDATAGQQAILGNHWMDWFDEFVDNLMGDKGGPYLGNLGAPVVTNPSMIQVLMKYKQLRDPVFLSHHVNIVDNNKVSTVKNTHREDTAQLGDAWNSTKKDNTLTSKTNENFKPVDGPKPEYNDKHIEPSTTPTAEPGTTPATTGVGGTTSTTNGVTTGATPSIANGATNAINTNPPAEPLSSITSNPKIDKLISFLKSKKYRTYDQIGVLNIVAFQSSKKDDGSISNKFDDILNIFYKNQNGNWELLEYQITTMPGYFPKTELLPEGVGLLALGQYADLCKLDTYTSDPTTIPVKTDKCLKIDEVTIHINDSTKIYNYKSEKINVKSIVLLHKSSDVGSAESVFNYSGGAQVFKTVSQWDQFITLCESQVTTAKKDTFTYTFCKQSDFDTFVPTTSETTPTTPTVEATNTTPTVTQTPTTTEPQVTGFNYVDILGIYDNNLDKDVSITLKNVNIQKYNQTTGSNNRLLTDDQLKKFLEKELKITLSQNDSIVYEEVIKWTDDTGNKYAWGLFGIGYKLGTKKLDGLPVVELPYGTYDLSLYYGGTKIQTVSVENNGGRFQNFY